MINISHGRDLTSESLQIHAVLSIGSQATEIVTAASAAVPCDGTPQAFI